MIGLKIIRDNDRAAIDKIVAQQTHGFLGSLENPQEPVNFDVGPWYLEGEFGYVSDSEDASRIANNVFAEFDLGKHLVNWTTDYERYVIGQSIMGLTFKGMYWGRTLAGRIFDDEL